MPLLSLQAASFDLRFTPGAFPQERYVFYVAPLLLVGMVAETEAQFQEWLVAERRPATEPTGALARRGHDLFVTGACAMCHRIRGTTAGATVAPDLTHVARRAMLAAGTLPNTTGHLAGWIMDPQSAKPGALMPAQSLDADDLQAMLAYLGTLK